MNKRGFIAISAIYSFLLVFLLLLVLVMNRYYNTRLTLTSYNNDVKKILYDQASVINNNLSEGIVDQENDLQDISLPDGYTKLSAIQTMQGQSGYFIMKNISGIVKIEMEYSNLTPRSVLTTMISLTGTSYYQGSWAGFHCNNNICKYAFGGLGDETTLDTNYSVDKIKSGILILSVISTGNGKITTSLSNGTNTKIYTRGCTDESGLGDYTFGNVSGNDNNSYNGSYKIEEVKVYDETGKVIADYIPVSVNGTAKMYDTINKVALDAVGNVTGVK